MLHCPYYRPAPVDVRSLAVSRSNDKEDVSSATHYILLNTNNAFIYSTPCLTSILGKKVINKLIAPNANKANKAGIFTGHSPIKQALSTR